MKHLHLLIPDLFPPQDIAAEACTGLRLPALGKLLSRARVTPCSDESLEDRLCNVFGVQAVAPVRAAADGLDTGRSYWLCADPVNLQLQRAQALLMPDVIPLHEEALAMCATLNEHFAGMGLHFVAPHAQRWYVQLEEEQRLTTTPLKRAAWGDAKYYQPQGEDALRWQRVTTEVQMLLYVHPFNQAREAQGELLINSLWLWGGGRAQPLKETYDAVGGDSDLAGAFAQVAGTPQIESLQAMLDGDFESGLWVCAEPSDAMRRGDLFAWRESVQRIEQKFAQPLLQALQTGRLQRLTLEVLREGGAQSFELNRSDAWKFWRSARSLARYAV